MEDKAIERENILAKEIRQVYCHVKRLRKYQAILLAQSNGLAAAKALNIKDKCSRVQVYGENLLLKQCQHKTTTFSAMKTNCGFEPFANGSKIAKDGYTLITFQPCYWQGSIVNFNGHLQILERHLDVDPTQRKHRQLALDRPVQGATRQKTGIFNSNARSSAFAPNRTNNIFGDLTAQMSLTNSDT